MDDRPKLETLRILRYPEPLLRLRSTPVQDVDGYLRELAQAMAKLLAEARGVGLAGNQIGLAERFVIVNATGEENRYQAFLNPEIIAADGVVREEEGCLSVPGVNARVRRADHVIVEATMLDGERVRMEAEGLVARCWQHEIDHLNGTLFVDKVGAASKIRIRPRLRELEDRFRERKK